MRVEYDDRMTAEYYPLQILLAALSGWVNREQQRTIEYLVEENRVLKERLKGRKLRLSDASRRTHARLSSVRTADLSLGRD